MLRNAKQQDNLLVLLESAALTFFTGLSELAFADHGKDHKSMSEVK